MKKRYIVRFIGSDGCRQVEIFKHKKEAFDFVKSRHSYYIVGAIMVVKNGKFIKYIKELK